VLLNRPDHAAVVFVSRASAFRKGSANRRAKSLLGEGLLTTEGARHTESRRAMQPVFARQRLESCASIIVDRTRMVRDAWRPGELVDVTRSMGALTFGVVGEAIVGARVDAQFDEVRAITEAATATIDPLLSLIAPLRSMRQARARLRVVAATLLERASRAEEGSLLALLREHDPEPAVQAQRVDDLVTLLLAGHDTLTSALAWVWLLLASHPDVETRLHDELATVLGGRNATAADVSALPFTKAVLAEALRLYPPAWILARQAVESQPFEEGEVAAGALVLVSPYLMHRDARWFERPARFEPDRWLGNQERPKTAYMPFGAGPRSCIGESFAWLEGVLILATIAQRWKFTMVGPIAEPDLRITLRPRGNVFLRACPQ
jgi:cytochrome P450